MSSDPRKAVILLSGGLDSATVLAQARADDYECYALSFDYGQRHRCELNAAHRVAEAMGVQEHRVFDLNLRQFGGSALTDDQISVPDAATDDSGEEGIPVTYVPARNTIFLSLALAWSEVLGARDIFIGVNSVDYSGYPDCRPEFIEAFQNLANLATKEGIEGSGFQLNTPLISLTKAEIIRRGSALGVDYGLTISCYNPDEHGGACGQCDSCSLRREGFRVAGVADPTHYS